ncbi:MAG: GTPase Era [Pseudomonadales bacterium]|nr:GTPase Era [Pseudomonadales bacterium]
MSDSHEDSVVSTRCGYAALIGRPNVGKSTLLNYLLGQKVSITSRKPQTTRHRLIGIKTDENTQVLYVDTPGIHDGQKKAINRYMNQTAVSVLRDVDVVVWMTDRASWNEDDEKARDAMRELGCPLIIAVNKIDLLAGQNVLVKKLTELAENFPDAELVPISATTGENVSALEGLVSAAMPPGRFLFPDDQITDRSVRFMVAETVREKIMRQLGEELPYAVTVQVDEFKDDGKTIHIDMTAYVERQGQKVILIGKSGQRLKRIGTDARTDIEALLSRKVMLNLWVKVKSGWSDDERALRSLGYRDE